MNLDEAQKQKVREWIASGLQPADVQKRLSDELGLKLTYMEVRFLLADLDLRPKDKDVPPPPSLANKASAPGQPGAAGDETGNDVAGSGGVKVSVDQLARPGALVSGQVTFSDGKTAEWHLDQMGRLALAPKEKGYKPPQRDVMDFQVALQNELARLGY
jgi:hypothetical protein